MDRRWSPRLIQRGPKPVDIAPGDWVEVIAPVERRPYCLGRLGRVHLVFWFIWTWARPTCGKNMEYMSTT